MRAQIKLGRIAGIAVGLHYSWFIIALLITLSLADHFHSVTSQWSSGVVWASAIITGLFFFVALLMHELAHCLVAQAHGMRVQAITLFALGGISQIESDVPDANVRAGDKGSHYRRLGPEPVIHLREPRLAGTQ